MRMSEGLTPADLRRRAEETLAAPGKRRIRLRRQLDEVEAELRPLVVAAHRNEVGYRRITELTGLSPATIRAWTRSSDDG